MIVIFPFILPSENVHSANLTERFIILATTVAVTSFTVTFPRRDMSSYRPAIGTLQNSGHLYLKAHNFIRINHI